MSWVVALRKESVDRNVDQVAFQGIHAQSLSARRAWIEMARGGNGMLQCLMSLSARRAWIEIQLSVRE